MSDARMLCDETDTDERCPDGNCRACHKSLTFEECCDGSWNARIRASAGLPDSNGTGRVCRECV